MVAAAKGGEVLENYEFEDVDGHGYVFNDLKGDLTNEAAMPLYKVNALYGTTAVAGIIIMGGAAADTGAGAGCGATAGDIAAVDDPDGGSASAACESSSSSSEFTDPASAMLGICPDR